jgi:hypothetical protein
MNGCDTIVRMLQNYFSNTDATNFLFDDLWEILTDGLSDTDDRTPVFNELDDEINYLARFFSTANRHPNTIQRDLFEIVENWWDSITWARTDIRITIEKEDLLGDLLHDTIIQIKAHFNNNGYRMERYYTYDVLEALNQLQTTNDIELDLRDRLEANGIWDNELNILLQFFRQLSRRYGFEQQPEVFLRLLLMKKDRNYKRHTDDKVLRYERDCNNNGGQPSFDGYIQKRGLDIDDETLPHYRRLFRYKYNI